MTVLTLATAIILALLGLTATAWAAVPEVEVELVPTSVKLPSEGDVEVLVVARNPVTHTLRDVRLSSFTDAGVNVTVEAPASNVLVPYGALAWTLRLSQADEGPVGGTVHVRIDYLWVAEDQGRDVPGVVHDSLEVTARQPEPAEEVAQVRVETAVTSLMQHRPAMVCLVVTNVSDLPLQVTEISARGPEFVTFAELEPTAGVTLAPREARAFPFEVGATGTVRPGKHLLMYEVAYQWRKAGSMRTGTAIATHEVQVGVLGESEILTVLGVPSFLVLPGFLTVMTVGLLWRFRAPGSREFPLKAKEAEFWVVAITLSLFAALIYPVVTGWRGEPRSYLEGYGLGDVMQVWFGSVLLGTVGYLAAATGLNLRGRVARLYWARRRPSPADSPVIVLRKLHRQGLGVTLPQVTVEVEGAVQQAFVLEQAKADRETMWVGPSMVVNWAPGADNELRKKVHDQLAAARGTSWLGRLLRRNKGTAGLANLLEDGEKEGALRVMWKRTGRLEAPYEVKRKDVQQILQSRLIIE